MHPTGEAPLTVVHREMFKTATPLRRSLLSLALSLLLHGGVLVGVVALAAAAAGRPAALSPASLIFVSVSAPPRVLPELSAPEPAPEARPELVAVLDFPEPALEFIVAKSITWTEPEAEPVPAPEPEIAAVPDVPPPPSIYLGLFGEGQQVADTVQAGEVRATGFAQEVAEVPQVMARVATVGVLDAASDAPRPGLDRRTATVTSAGFGGPVAAAAEARPRPSVVTGLTGFGASLDGTALAPRPSQDAVRMVAGFGAPVEPGPGPVLAAPVAASGFEVELPDASVVASAAPTGPPDALVEVVFKPTPEYRRAAGAAGLEGDVALEVDFSSSGTVRVLRVVEGLGHGLDEMAIRAAEQMRFTPAIRNGHKVDTRAIVYIVFRLI